MTDEKLELPPPLREADILEFPRFDGGGGPSSSVWRAQVRSTDPRERQFHLVLDVSIAAEPLSDTQTEQMGVLTGHYINALRQIIRINPLNLECTCAGFKGTTGEVIPDAKCPYHAPTPGAA